MFEKAIKIILSEPPELHYPSYYADLLRESCSEIPNSSDTISRQAALNALDEQIRQCDKALSAFDISMKDAYAVKVERASLVAFRETLEYVPSAQIKRKNGKWIDNSPVTMKCNQCGFVIKDWDWHRFKCCPNCGANMKGEQDDESRSNSNAQTDTRTRGMGTTDKSIGI